MAFKYIGTSSTIITDGGVQNPTINGVIVTTKNEGDIVFYTDKRFLWTSNAWKYQGDINTHTDVQDALNTIMEAYKGEEIRGSIYDAIALIDTRSTAMEEIVGGNVDNIVETKIPTFDITYTISAEVATCNRTYEDIKAKIDSGKKPLFYIITPSASDPSILIRHACTVNFTEESYDGGYFYRIHLYYIDADSSYLHVYRNRILHYSARIHLNSSDEYSIPIGGGGGSYTEGEGIDINNGEISVKLRSSNPGLAFDNDGNLYATGSGGSYTEGDGIDITNNVISIDEPVYITMTEGANGIVDTSFITSITEANFLAKFSIDVKDLMAIFSGSYNVAKLGIKVYDDTSTSMDAYLDKIPILDVRYSKYDEELLLSEGAKMIFIWDHCLYEFNVNVEYSDEFRGTISKINGYIAKASIISEGYGIDSAGNSVSVNTNVIQKKLTSTNAGTGISIANDDQGNPVISLELPQAEGGGF